MKTFNTLFAETIELEDKAKKIKRLEEEKTELRIEWDHADNFPHLFQRKIEIEKRLAEIEALLGRLTRKLPWDKLLASLNDPQ